MTTKTAPVGIVYTRPDHLITICPHCQEEQEGWVASPLGKEDRCDDCGEKYSVSVDAKIEVKD